MKINYFYSLLTNFLNLLFPLLILPYIFRVLGSDNLGKYYFSLSVAQWFLIAASFGIATYGVRSISIYKNDLKKLNKVFSELFIINIITTILSMILYVIIIINLGVFKTELELHLIFLILIISNLFGVDWLLMGLERFKNIAIRNLIAKTLTFILVFIFVKNENDYLVFALITVVSTFLINGLNFAYSFKFVRIRFNDLNILNHSNFLIIFFVSSIIISSYSVIDRIILGILSTNTDVALYSLAKQVYMVLIGVTLSLSSVLLPQSSNFAITDSKKYKDLLDRSLKVLYFISIPLVIVVLIFSKEIVQIIGGEEFIEASISLSIMAILILVVSISTWNYNQILLAQNLEKIGLKIQLLIAIASVILNFTLIPTYGHIGATLSLVVAEMIGLLASSIYVKKRFVILGIRYFNKNLFIYVITSFVLISVSYWFNSYIYEINKVFLFFISLIFYYIILKLLREEITNEVWNTVLNSRIIGFLIYKLFKK